MSTAQVAQNISSNILFDPKHQWENIYSCEATTFVHLHTKISERSIEI